MKSIIQEASSITKAIEQALEKAGNPKDFSVKILEYPEKNFFRITIRSAKIALYWDEKGTSSRRHLDLGSSDGEQPARTREHRERSEGRSAYQRDERQRTSSDTRESREPRESRDARDRDRDRDRDSGARTGRYQDRHRDRRDHQAPRSEQPMHERQERPERRPHAPTVNNTEVDAPAAHEGQRGEVPRDMTRYDMPREPRWNAEMESFAREWLTTTFRELGRTDIMIAVTHENFLLRVMLDQPFTTDTDKERKLFASLALLLLEALKRKFRTNMGGHKIVITHH